MERKYINIFEDIAKDELLGLLDKYDIDYEITNKSGEKMTILSGEEAKKVLEEVKEIPSKEAIDKARENGKKLVEKYKQYTKQVGERNILDKGIQRG